MENNRETEYDQHATIPIWLVRHAVTCWWNEKPINGGTPDLDKLSEMLQKVADSQGEKVNPVAWQYRWLNPSNSAVHPEMLEWKPCVPKYAGQDLEGRIKELRSYEIDGKPLYEVRALYSEVD
jgi:hypothetical protein